MLRPPADFISFDRCDATVGHWKKNKREKCKCAQVSSRQCNPFSIVLFSRISFYFSFLFTWNSMTKKDGDKRWSNGVILSITNYTENDEKTNRKTNVFHLRRNQPKKAKRTSSFVCARVALTKIYWFKTTSNATKKTTTTNHSHAMAFSASICFTVCICLFVFWCRRQFYSSILHR